MKKLKMNALVGALMAVATSSVMAQSTDAQAWSGFYGEAKVGYASFMPTIGNGNLSLRGGAVNDPFTSTVSNLNTATAAISGGYNFVIDSNKVIGIGFSYYPGASGSGNGAMTPAAPGALVNLNYQLKNLYGITIQPGLALDKDRLVYAKVGYTGVTVGASGVTPSGASGLASSIPYQTANLSGYTLGLGYKQILSGGWYAVGEVNYAGYSTKTINLNSTTAGLGAGVGTTTLGGSGIDFLVGVGYRF